MTAIVFLGVWGGSFWLMMQLFPPPQSQFVALISSIGTFFFAGWVAQQIEDNNRRVKGSNYVYPGYPENWPDIRMRILARDRHVCGNCETSKNLHVHHIVPLSKGGSNRDSNLRTLCENCHKKLHPHMRD